MSTTPTTAPSSVQGLVLPPSNAGPTNPNVLPSATPAGPPANVPIETYVPNERVLCYHGPLIYEAKVMKVKVFEDNNNIVATVGPHYLVHYKGWKQTWDEWVPPTRLLKMTEENLAEQKSLQQKPLPTGHGGGAGRGAGRGGGGGAGGPFGGPGSKEAVRGRKEARGTKRGRDEDDGIKKSEMKLNIPEVLKAMLVDDWEAVTKNNQIVNLPISPTVAEILSQFAEYVRRTQPTHLKEPKFVIQTFIDGLQTYFDRALGNCLLYRFERVQYSTIRRLYWTGTHVIVGQERPMSMIYGAEHLLRMLVNLPQMVAQANLDIESVLIIRDYTNELMSWMVGEKDRIFQREYVNADVQYQNLSRS